MTTMVLNPEAWTREERDRLPDDGCRHELLDGVLIVSPSPRRLHQRVAQGVYRQLFGSCPAELEALTAPLDVTLAPDTVVQPDVFVAPRDVGDDLRSAELAIEVLSPSSRSIDRVLKFDRYRRAGVPSYWIVDPDGPALTAFELRDGQYVQVAEVTGEESWTATQPFPVTLTPARWAE